MNNNCDREWTRQFLRQTFTQVFINKNYKKHRENVLFNNERALLPATQPIVEAVINKEKIQRDINSLRDEITRREAEIRQLQNEYNIADRIVTGRSREDTVRAVFVRACPEEECRGFLSTQWKCGICEKWTCPDCHQVKGTERDCEHVCHPDNIATASLLSRDTKPCPKCGTGIFKIDGCDQMWCTQCHTAFSWRTGRIEDVVHNPHYYEWMRRNAVNGVIPRNPGDVPGGNQCPARREITHNTVNEISRYITTIRTLNDADKTQLRNRVSRLCQSIIHMRYNELVRYNYNYLRNNQSHRVEYMRNNITEEKFKTVIQQNDKKYQKNREILNVFTLLSETSTDIILRFYESIQKRDPITTSMNILDEINAIVTYANECFVDISHTYNSVTIVVSPVTLVTEILRVKKP
jgi:ribosomal protein S27AE